MTQIIRYRKVKFSKKKKKLRCISNVRALLWLMLIICTIGILFVFAELIRIENISFDIPIQNGSTAEKYPNIGGIYYPNFNHSFARRASIMSMFARWNFPIEKIHRIIPRNISNIISDWNAIPMKPCKWKKNAHPGLFVIFHKYDILTQINVVN